MATVAVVVGMLILVSSAAANGGAVGVRRLADPPLASSNRVPPSATARPSSTLTLLRAQPGEQPGHDQDTDGRLQLYSAEDYSDLLINHYSRQTLALYSVGLRKFLLDGVGPLGCLPSLRASGLGPQGQCVDQVNQMVGFFNQGLRSLVDKLNADHPDAMFIYGNTYDAVYNMINNPHKYGFRVMDSGCCVLGEDGTCEPYAEPCEICSS
ncbi:GDSL-motif lipase/acylhydrolase-like [Oryza sativa Japonica Group]|uniref:GDSL-motif lipase/acylhydrolase-like n=1 Tax=Oryza sativa subsp. japonica TaxID=39947 RepID=Q5JN48_ORYSJ|nr:GDSL-motif lipase/acylhydrolase-like [Oryza sativa Japonica Group]